MIKSLLIFLITGSLFAHSQMPIIYGGKENKLDSISLKQAKVVPIRVQNLNNFPQNYVISVNGEKVGETSILTKGEIQKINVVVKIKKENQLEVHKICTTSIPNNNKEMFNTKVCTKAYLYWTKDR